MYACFQTSNDNNQPRKINSFSVLFLTDDNFISNTISNTTLTLFKDVLSNTDLKQLSLRCIAVTAHTTAAPVPLNKEFNSIPRKPYGTVYRRY